MNLALRILLPFQIGYFLSYLLRNVNAVIAPDLTRELGLDAAALGLLTSAYLLAFAAFQLPLGVLLDRYGPRKVEGGLLLVAAAGCALFGLGDSLGTLAWARAAIGLGVSACLMASFKAFSLWYPNERQPSLNAAVMVAGSLGALFATLPVAWAVPAFGWRGVFFGLAGLFVLSALGVFSTPEKAGATKQESLAELLQGLVDVARSRVFWRYAPQATMVTGGYMALQGLWAIPWLMDVNGYSRDQAAFHLLLTTVGMLLGFLAITLFIVPLTRRGIPPVRVLVGGVGMGLLCLLAMWLDLGLSQLLWFALGMCFSVTNLAYALMTAHFPVHLAGRANTVLNLGIFVGAFALQWGYGALLNLLQAQGWALAEAHRAVFGGMLALQVASFAWFLLSDRKPSSVKG